jgi:hypothetical protein
MSDKKISELPIATVLNNTDVILIVQGTTTKQITKENLVASLILAWNQLIDIPSPILTIDGDITGSETITELGDTTLTLTIGNTVTEAKINLADVPTLNTSTAKHGLCPKLSNDPTTFLNGAGVFSTVSSGAAAGFIQQDFSGETSLNIVHNLNGYPIVQVINGSQQLFSPTSLIHNTLNDFTVNFSPAASGTVIASLGSPGIPSISLHAVDYTLTISDNVVVATVPLIFTLPLAATCAGKIYIIKRRTAGGEVTIVGSDDETIDGNEELILKTNYSSVHVVSDGTEWLII